MMVASQPTADRMLDQLIWLAEALKMVRLVAPTT
jgi:hypothetical protein